jgi:hypothetical protein
MILSNLERPKKPVYILNLFILWMNILIRIVLVSYDFIIGSHGYVISRSLLHKIVFDKLRFWKLCSRLVLKMLMEEHKMKRRPVRRPF